MKSLEKGQRDASLDMISGLLIIHMILGHCLQRTGAMDSWLYHKMEYLYFFMPWFFYKNGMFYHPSSLKQTAWGGVKRLLKPFVLYSFIGHILYCLKIWIDGDKNWIHFVLTPLKEIVLGGACQGNLPLWFLLSLFAVRIIAYLVFRSKEQVLFLMTIGILIPTLLYYLDLKTPLYFANIFLGIFYFLSGNILREVQYQKYIAFAGIIAYVLFCILGLTVVDMRGNTLEKGCYLLHPIAGLCGIIAINNISKWLKFKFEWLLKIGKNSMNYYVTHWICISIILILVNFLDSSLSGKYLVITVICFLVIILPFVNFILINFTERATSRKVP